MLSFPRFDLSESTYALLLMARKTPAWREVYTKILDELILRHTTYWAAIDWITKIGPDPNRANYPRRYKVGRAVESPSRCRPPAKRISPPSLPHPGGAGVTPRF